MDNSLSFRAAPDSRNSANGVSAPSHCDDPLPEPPMVAASDPASAICEQHQISSVASCARISSCDSELRPEAVHSATRISADPEPLGGAPSMQDDSLKEEFGIARGFFDTSSLLADFNSLQQADTSVAEHTASALAPAAAAPLSGRARQDLAAKSPMLAASRSDNPGSQLPAIEEDKVRILPLAQPRYDALRTWLAQLDISPFLRCPTLVSSSSHELMSPS